MKGKRKTTPDETPLVGYRPSTIGGLLAVRDGMVKKPSPWSAREVTNLANYQSSGRLHEFTGPDGDPLIPTREGWRETPDGPVVQDWAWVFMLEWNGDKDRRKP